MDDWTALAAELEVIFSQHGDELADELAARYPAFADQMQAATADATTRHARTTAAIAATRRTGKVEVDATVRAQINGHVLRIVTGLANGSVAHCPHIRINAPAAAIAVVWSGRVDCPACFPDVPTPRLSDVEDRTCDLCGSYVPGQTMHCIMPRCGPLMLSAGICDECLHRMEAGQ
jgi:hypothetical protein